MTASSPSRFYVDPEHCAVVVLADSRGLSLHGSSEFKEPFGLFSRLH